MAFRDVKGQEKVINFLLATVEKGKLGGAYLFIGPQGVGKTTVARNLAKILNCESMLRDEIGGSDSCDRCPACRKIDNFNHPDVRWITPHSPSRNILIEDIRNIQEDISLKPYESKKKIYIILEADSMTEEAANCLLKTLEEPTGDSLLILTASISDRLLPTILSRCQKVNFSLMRKAEIEKILIADFGVEANNAHFLAGLSEGKLGKAVGLKERDIVKEKNKVIDQFTAYSSIPKDGESSMDAEAFEAKNKEEIEEALEIAVSWYRDILALKCGVDTSMLINVDRKEELMMRANAYSYKDLEKIVETINATYNYLRQNVNAKLAVDVMIMKLRQGNGLEGARYSGEAEENLMVKR